MVLIPRGKIQIAIGSAVEINLPSVNQDLLEQFLDFSRESMDFVEFLVAYASE